jgi:hypothetical protein
MRFAGEWIENIRQFSILLFKQYRKQACDMQESRLKVQDMAQSLQVVKKGN